LKKSILILLSFLFLTGCTEIQTSDPQEAYKHWAGSAPPENVRILKGQYWQSAHWTKEYILYLKLKPTKKWWAEFVNQNQLQKAPESWTKPANAAFWFDPPENSIMYSSGAGFDQGSRYFRDTITGTCYIYEIQF
jgi:hypothetical protein